MVCPVCSVEEQCPDVGGAATGEQGPVRGLGVPGRVGVGGASCGGWGGGGGGRGGRRLGGQAGGDGGWRASARPGNTGVGWTAPKGSSASRPVAVDPHARVVGELTGRRTAYADFYQLSDGRVRETLSAAPVNYPDARAAGHPIHPSVRAVRHPRRTPP